MASGNLHAGSGEPEPIEVHRDVSSGVLRLRTTEWHSPGVDRHAPPIVILPGVLAPRLSFRPLARLLAAEFRVIAVDLPGFGESEKPAPHRYAYGVPAFAEAIGDLFSGLGLSRAHVLGHGVGGAAAVRLAASHPELVKRLTLVAPIAHPAKATWGLSPLIVPVLGGLLLRQLIGRSLYFRLYKDRVNPAASPENLQAYYDAFSAPASRSALLATLRASQDARSLIADLRLVRAPTLLVWGRDDRLIPVESGRYLSREMPQAGVEIITASHSPHEECPEQTARVLSDFFAGRRAGAS